MKRTLLSLYCVSLFGASVAMAMPLSLQKVENANRLPELNSANCFYNEKVYSNTLSQQTPSKAPSGLWMNWGYCGSPYNAFQMPEGTLKGAIMVTKEIATQWEGAEISAVQVANPTNQSYSNPLAGEEVTVWVSETLDGEPVCTGTGVLGENGFEYSSIDLTTPYILEANKPVYIGYTLEVPNPSGYRNGLFTLVTDYSYPPNDHTAYVYSKANFNKDGEMVTEATASWKSFGQYMGSLCLTATISGDMLPQNQADLVQYSIPSVIKPDTDFEFMFISQNYGANKVSDIDVTLSIEGEEPQVKHVILEYGPLEYNGQSLDAVSFTCSRVGNNIPYSIYISSVNGEPVEESTKIKGYFLCIENGFKRNVVVEEATGTWCGWCVRGYVGMEYMKENYSDKGFIGIALHSGDAMEVLDPGAYSDYYYQVASGGFPNSFMNRNWNYSIDPDPNNLEEEFLYMVELPAYAQINAELTANDADGKNVTLKTKTSFAADEETANYGIAYTVVEDNVGPYVQTNYYAGGAYGEFYGYEKMGSSVPLTYNDVARNCSHPVPFDNSVPTTITGNTEYEYSMDIELTGVKDLNNYRVVAMVIDNTTGEILNACEVAPEESGVEEILNNASELRVIGAKGMLTINGGVANVYAADGRMVAANVNGNVTLPAGLYIVANGNKTVKVVVR
ncbi:MAG: Omp28-related outer membrane protein [Bacteroides sp.]|nr:Omp28-related outer membrane protein [Bacteroides sp.]